MSNETVTPRNLNYNFIAVPTNLFFALDPNLRNALTVLIQLSSVYADADGFFFRTNEDLQSDFKMGKNLTVAVLESLYRYDLLQVKSVGFTKKNGKRKVNFFRVNFEHFKDFEKYHIYTITKNEELHLETVDYKAKDYRVTYTSSTVEETEKAGNTPSIPSNDGSGIVASNEQENAPAAQEIPSCESIDSSMTDTVQAEPQAEPKIIENRGYNSNKVEPFMLVKPKDELDDILGDVVVAETPAPTPSKRKYKPSEAIDDLDDVLDDIFGTEPKEDHNVTLHTYLAYDDSKTVDDERTIKKCRELIARFRQKKPIDFQQLNELAAQATHYFDLQVTKGLISKHTDFLITKELLNERNKMLEELENRKP